MTQFLLPDFLNDPNQYEQVEMIWRGQWDSLIRELGQEASWQTPWLNTRFNDGSPFRDGNPIFSAVCPSRHLGVRVIQVEPADDPNEFTAWTDTFAKGEPEATEELVIHCVLSDQTLSKAFGLIRKWISPEQSGPDQVYAILGERFDSDQDTAECRNDQRP